MKIIDRYLIRQFLRTFGICFVSLLGLYVVFDLFSNMDEFFREGGSVRGVVPLALWFYSFRTLSFFDELSAVLALIAAMFTVAVLQRHNEMVAIMAAGVSKLRAVAPILCAAVAIAVLAAASRELLIPRFGSQLTMTPQDFDNDDEGGAAPLKKTDSQTLIEFAGTKYVRAESRIVSPTVTLPSPLNKYGKSLRAKEALYRDQEGERPSGYLLRGVSSPTGIASKPSLALDGRPIIITPLDAEWLQSNECFVVSNLSFEALTTRDEVLKYASTFSLIRLLRSPNIGYRSNLRVAVHARIIQPVLDVALLFLGMPIVLRRSSQNVFLALGACALIVIGYLVLKFGSHWLGTYTTPMLGAWLPLMVVLPIAVAMFDSMRE